MTTTTITAALGLLAGLGITTTGLAIILGLGIIHLGARCRRARHRLNRRNRK